MAVVGEIALVSRYHRNLSGVDTGSRPRTLDLPRHLGPRQVGTFSYICVRVWFATFEVSFSFELFEPLASLTRPSSSTAFHNNPPRPLVIRQVLSIREARWAKQGILLQKTAQGSATSNRQSPSRRWPNVSARQKVKYSSLHQQSRACKPTPTLPLRTQKSARQH